MAATRKSQPQIELLPPQEQDDGVPNESGLRPRVELTEEALLRLTLAQRDLEVTHLRRQLERQAQRLEAQDQEFQQATRCQLELCRQLRQAVSRRDETIRQLEAELRELRAAVVRGAGD